METEKRTRGRPRKKEGRIEPWQFARAAIVMYAYDEVRKSGQKHCVSVTQALEFVRHGDFEMPISETEVRRILATFDLRNDLCRSERSRVLESMHWQRVSVGEFKLGGK
jgi:hypothetical protein